MASVLVTDGDQRAALAVVRSLGQAGHTVHVCATVHPSLAGSSRSARSQHLTPDPLTDPASFVLEVRRRIEQGAIDVLLPVTEAALLALLPYRSELGDVRLPFPSAEVFQRISDKRAVLQVARRAGIAVPAQRVIWRPPGSEHLDLDGLSFPVAVKPSRSVAETNGRRAKQAVAYARGPDHLRQLLAVTPPGAYPVLVQQRISGPGIGVFLLLWQGELLARFCHQRLREKPPSGGVSVYRESVMADPGLVRRSRELLESLGAEGVAMVEYKVDQASATPYLMEVNGRFWGSLQLAIDAGVDFPRLLVSAALGERTTPVLEYRIGIRSRWWWGDLDHLIARVRGSEPRFPETADHSGRLAAVRDFAKLWRPGDRNEVLRLSDPWPFVRETIDWFRAL